MRTTQKERRQWLLSAATHGTRNIAKYSAGLTVDQLVRLLRDVKEAEADRDNLHAAFAELWARLDNGLYGDVAAILTKHDIAPESFGGGE